MPRYLGIVILVLLYLAICLQRWKVGRHYGEPLRLLGYWDLKECWEYTRFSPYCTLIRAGVIAWACAGAIGLVFGQ